MMMDRKDLVFSFQRLLSSLRRRRSFSSATTAAFVVGVIVLVASSNANQESHDSITVIRQSSQAYLDRYFEKFTYPHGSTVHPSTPNVSLKSLPAETVREQSLLCLDVVHQHMKQFRAVYLEEAKKAATRLNVREDDSLRLFFVGDLITCLENVDHSTHTRRRALQLSAKEVNRVLMRGVSTPVEFSESQAAALSSIAIKFLEAGEQTKSEGKASWWIDLLFSYVPMLGALDGPLGFVYCVLSLIVIFVLSSGVLFPSRLPPVKLEEAIVSPALPDALDFKHARVQHRKKKGGERR